MKKNVRPFSLFFVTTFCLLTYFDIIYFFDLHLHLHVLGHLFFNAMHACMISGIVCAIMSKSKKAADRFYSFVCIVYCFIFLGEAIHYKSVHTFALWEEIIRAKELTGVAGEVLKMIPLSSILYLLPVILLSVYVFYLKRKHYFAFLYDAPKLNWKKTLLFLLSWIIIMVSTNAFIVYAKHDNNKQSLKNSKDYIARYGLVDAALYSTIKYFIYDHFTPKFNAAEFSQAKDKLKIIPEKNEVTNRYKGKNIVYITGESVAPYAINEELTPTLSRLQKEAYNFSNYYSVRPNTLNSEFAMLTSFYLTPEKEKQDFKVISGASMPGLFKKQGYNTVGFHSFKADFYNRKEKFVDLGFDEFLGIAELGIPEKPEVFAHDDVKMFKESTKTPTHSAPFFHYYLTVTTHGYYLDKDRNDEDVPHIREKIALTQKAYPQYSEMAQTYMASAGILDDGIKVLMKDLETKQLLDDTVIVFVGDHYPYMMSDEEIIQNYGINNLDLYKVPFFIWDNTKPQKEVTTRMSNVDILPTLANMFDLPLVYGMGIDVFSKQISQIVLEWYDYRGYSFLTQTGGFDGNEERYYGDVTKQNVDTRRMEIMEREKLNTYQWNLSADSK